MGQSRILRADGSVAAEAPACGDAVIAARIVRRRPPQVRVDERRRRLFSSEPPGLAPVASPRPVKVAAVPSVVADERFRGGTGEELFKPLQDQGVTVLLSNVTDESVAERLAILARAFDIHAVGFPRRADVFALGPARAGCVAGQAVHSFAPARALALEGAELLLYFGVLEDLTTLRTRAAENRVFLMGANQRSALIIGPDGQVLARTQGEPPAVAVAVIDLTEAANKLVAPRTDIFQERRVGAYRF